jgi:hypothetical protein
MSRPYACLRQLVAATNYFPTEFTWLVHATNHLPFTILRRKWHFAYDCVGRPTEKTPPDESKYTILPKNLRKWLFSPVVCKDKHLFPKIRRSLPWQITVYVFSPRGE